LEVVLIVGGNNNITHHVMCTYNDMILERKCTYIAMEGTSCLCTIFFKRM